MSLNDTVQRLKSVGLLSVLNEDALRLIAFNSPVRHSGDGASLFFEGEEADGAVFLLDGDIALRVFSRGESHERIRLQRNAVIDPYAMISAIRRDATAVAVGPISYLTIDRDTFRRVLEEYPDAAERIQDYIMADMEETVGALNAVADDFDAMEEPG